MNVLKLTALLSSITLSLGALTACDKMGGGGGDPKSDKEKISYSIGFQLAKNIQSQQVDVDSAMIKQAFDDVMAEKDPRISQSEMKSAMKKMYEKRMAENKEKMSERKEKGKQAQADGAEYLEENKEKEGVQVTESGLQYKVVEEGSGSKPGKSDTVVVHYKGTLVDGTEFDSSYERGEPAEFPVSAVIPGWTEALQMMKEGAKWELVIPAELAYGERGRPNIPPNSVLLFDVELKKIKDDKQSATKENDKES